MIRMDTFDEIYFEIAHKFKNKEYDTLFPYISRQIANAEDNNEKNRLFLVKAECYQRIGELDSAQIVLDGIHTEYLKQPEKTDVDVLRLKILFQRGMWRQANQAASDIIELNQGRDNVLWRASLLSEITGDGAKAKRYRDQHLEIAGKGGFQAANNMIYTRTIPRMISGMYGESLVKEMNQLEHAGDIYLNSNINFDQNNKVGSRLKSFCQVVLIEAMLQWDYNNQSEAYKYAILTALFMKYAHLHLDAEGIGEVIKLQQNKYSQLMQILKKALNLTEEGFWVSVRRNRLRDIINRAYKDALDVYAAVIQKLETRENQEISTADAIQNQSSKENKKLMNENVSEKSEGIEVEKDGLHINKIIVEAGGVANIGDQLQIGVNGKARENGDM